MKTKFSMLILFAMLSFKSANSQTMEIYIEGKVTDTAIVNNWEKPEIMIRIHDPVKQLNITEEIVPVQIGADGSYHLYIKSDSLTYLSFWATHKSKGAVSPVFIKNLPTNDAALSQPYLFEAGDRIKADFKNGGIIHFSGAGSNKLFDGQGTEKLNCQFQLYQIPAIPLSIAARVTQLSNSGNYSEALKLIDQALKSAIQLKKRILESYSGKFNDEINNRIYLDAIAQAQLTILRPLWFRALGSDRQRQAVQKYFNEYKTVNFTSGLEQAKMAGSFLYMELLFEKIWNAHKLFSKDIKTGDSFKAIYEQIKINYTDKLRDQLLLICFRRLSEYFPEETRGNIDEAVATIKQPDLKKALENWKSKLFVAYPFELEDADGKIHKLSDYKGKVVVMDFWFTGCSWCSYLSAVMHSVMEQYKDNPDVVFITVSQDQDKELWLKSIASGKYTSPGTVNLYTNGLGSMHPILSYYNFIGAPQQLIIGRKGELITSAPPRPGAQASAYTSVDGVLNPNAKATLSSPNTLSFMKIINESL